MARVPVRRAWVDQPHGTLQVDWSNPITRGLVVLAHPAVGNLVNGQPWSRRGSNATVSGDLAGTAFKTIFNGTASDFSMPCTVAAAGDRTLVAFASNYGNSNGSLPVVSLEDADSADYLGLGAASFAASIDNNGAPTITVTESRTPRIYAARRIGNQVFGSVDRTFSAGSITGTRSLDTTTFRIGRAASSGVSTITTTVYWAAYWTRALSQDELRSLAASPNQLFTPQQRLIGAAGGAAFTCTGSGGISFSGAADAVEANDYAGTGAGGLSFSGAATASSSSDYQASGAGGIAFAGAATASTAGGYDFIGAGGLALGGAAAAAFTVNHAFAASGGIAFAGSAFAIAGEANVSAGSGGLVFSGSAAAVNESRRHGGSGGAEDAIRARRIQARTEEEEITLVVSVLAAAGVFK